ncbi:unnamed protein product, partial [Staurois parvus]
RASGHQASGYLARQRHRVIRYRIVWLDSGRRVTRYDSGHWGHQASGHLACQRAPRHLARQWAPGHQALDRATGSSGYSSGSTAGIGSPGIRSFGLASGHRVIWQGMWGTESPGTTAGSESIGTTAGTGSSGTGLSGSDRGYRVTRYDSGHQVI